MKAVRPLLIGFGILLVLLLLLLAAALSSSVQTWAARRALASQPDLHGTVGSVSAGFQRVRLVELRIERNGMVLTLPALEAELPLLSAARSRVQVTRLVAKGWTLDLTRAEGGPSAIAKVPARAEGEPREFSLLSTAVAAQVPADREAARSAFDGLLKQLDLPVDLTLDGVDLEGDVLLPAGPTEPPMRARVVVRGGGLAAGSEGAFAVELSGAKSDGAALEVHAKLVGTMDTPRTFARIGVAGDASVSGASFPQAVMLTFDTKATRSPGGEDYALLLSRGQKQLARVNAALSRAEARITGTWRVDLHDDDLTPFLLGRQLPTFAALGEGHFETETDFEEINASGKLNASASRLEIVQPELSAIGSLELTADFDLLQHGESLRVDRLDATVAGAAPVVAVRALQPFEFNLATAELRVADPAQDLLGVMLTGVPVAWAQRFLGDLKLTGGNLHGEFAASARDGGLALRARRPLEIRGLSLAGPDRPLLSELDLTLNASADYTPRGWQAQVVEFAVRRGGVLMLSLDAKAGQLAGDNQAVKVTGHWSADVPAWLAQPALNGQLQLASGNAQGEFSASIDGTKSVETKITLLNLAAANQQKLPAIHAELRGDLTRDGHLTFDIPLLFERDGRKSDLLLSGTVTPDASGKRVDARLSGQQVVLRDVQMLALLLPPSPAPAPADKPEDTAPPWRGVSGQVTLALTKVVYGEAFEVTNVGGAVRIEPNSLALEKVQAKFGKDSDLKMAGAVHYDPAAASGYKLSGEMALQDFDTGAAFRAIDPAKLPTVEAKVNLTGRLNGTGETLGAAVEGVRGDVQVTGKSGVFRALSADLTERVQRTQTTVAALGGILGAVTGSEKYNDLANKSQILTEIANALGEIPFDQLVATAVRDDQLNIVLKDFTLISPEVRLTGAGEIRHVQGLPVLAQPLNLQLNLGARGRFAELLKRAGLLNETQDNLGYAGFATQIKVGGSLAATDTDELKRVLLNSALEKSGLLDGLLGN